MKRNYPKNRKKKIPHEQYMDYRKVVARRDDVDCYHMIKTSTWWACKRGRHHGSFHVEKGGDVFTPVARVPAYTGCEFAKVFGYVARITVCHKRPFHYKFVFVSEPMSAAKCLQGEISKHYPNKQNQTGRPPKKHKP